jgi:hypothetical protein
MRGRRSDSDKERSMHIEVMTDRNVNGSERLISRVAADAEASLARFSGRLTRVEVHLGDENAEKAGPVDKRCMVEARPAGQHPVAVTDHAATLDEAWRGALQKMGTLLERRFGKLDARRRGATPLPADEL